MPISSKTLFHFTDTAEHLIGILQHEFFPRFCLEKTSALCINGEWPMTDSAFPMVCFCDLPLSNVTKHLDFYGKYGIGMTKEWGLNKGLNPIMYISRQSYLNECIRSLIQRAGPDVSKGAETEILDFFGFVKPIEGKMSRQNGEVDKYFYDEREWRYIPDFSKIESLGENFKTRLTEKEFKNEVEKASANKALEQKVQLSFEPNDIKYLIVASESEIIPTIEAIKVIKEKYDERTKALLSSRIISAKQIIDDF